MPTNKSLELGELVRRHRADAGLTQEQLAERVGLVTLSEALAAADS
jgi:transcriptional regulator with XRE-family HTH domain